jgi:glycogen debranching enzyme
MSTPSQTQIEDAINKRLKSASQAKKNLFELRTDIFNMIQKTIIENSDLKPENEMNKFGLEVDVDSTPWVALTITKFTNKFSDDEFIQQILNALQFPLEEEWVVTEVRNIKNTKRTIKMHYTILYPHYNE